MPKGLCFSPDEKKIPDTGVFGNPQPPAHQGLPSSSTRKLTNDRIFHDFDGHGTYIADDMRMNGVRIFAPDGTPIGAIVLREVGGNLCFGGHEHNRLFIAAS